MITVRPIHPEESGRFAAIGNPDKQVQASILDYTERMIAQKAMRPDWCFVFEKNNTWLGRIAFWTLPGEACPLAFVLWDLPWEEDDCLDIGRTLLRETIAAVQIPQGQLLGYMLDTPAMAPQWQDHVEKRQLVLEQLGFRLQRKTSRFEWTKSSQDAGTAVHLPGREKIIFRSLPEIGDDAFVEAIMQISAGTYDNQISLAREAKGPLEHARYFFREMQLMQHDPLWWQLAYAQSGELIGLLMPAKSPTFATIGYIGVHPEQRGRGYIDMLLNRATSILVQAGETYIRADTDVQNTPMANAFLRAGYQPFANRIEYYLSL